MPLEPIDEAAVLAAWAAGEITSSRAARTLGCDPVEARGRLKALADRGRQRCDLPIHEPLDGPVPLAGLRKFIYHRQADGAEPNEWEALEAVLCWAEAQVRHARPQLKLPPWGGSARGRPR